MRSLVSTASTLVTDMLTDANDASIVHSSSPDVHVTRLFPPRSNKKPRLTYYPSSSSSSFAVSSGAGAGAGAVFAFFRRGAPGDRDELLSVRA